MSEKKLRKKIKETKSDYKNGEHVNTDIEHGLTQEEVQRRHEQYGYNEVPERKHQMLWHIIKLLSSPMAWMLEIIMIVAWFLGNYRDLGIVTILFVGNFIMSIIQEYRASVIVQALQQKIYVRARVLRSGRWIVVPARDLVPGDVINVAVGDFIPADAIITSGVIEVDQSLLTGEAMSVEKKGKDKILSGSKVRSGEAKAIVSSIGIHTFFGQTIHILKYAAPKSHVEEIISNLTIWLLILVASILIVMYAVALYKGMHALEILPLFLVLVLSGIPVALPAMFTISMAVAAYDLAKEHVLITRLSASQDAASMNVICIDKTGTITLNKLKIVDIVASKGYSKQDVLLYGALASEQASENPIDQAFIQEANHENVKSSAFKVIKFSVFDPKTKKSEAEISYNGSTFFVTKGAVPVIMNLVHINEQENNYYETIIHNFALKGYRSLAIAKKNDSRFNLVGLVALEDPIRPDAYKTVQEIKDLGITVKILTGDNVAIAQEVAKDVGLKGHIISFAQHSAKDYHALKTLIETSDGFADIFPKDKYAIVQMLQSNKNIVGMTGDGINDAPALRQAEVGIAVSTATDIARESASVVLTQPGLYNIIDLVKQGRSIFERVSTWIFNKITRTIFKIIFIMIPFLILGKFIISSSALLLLILMTDFVKLSLSTDNERISQHPSIWNIKKLTAIAAIIGLVMVIQALILLFIGLHYFNFDENQHIYTYSFAILFYFAVCSILIARERGYFWQSVPGKIFLISIVIDTIVGFIITSFGWLGFKAISPWWSLGILLYASMCTFLINDALKQALFKKYGR